MAVLSFAPIVDVGCLMLIGAGVAKLGDASEIDALLFAIGVPRTMRRGRLIGAFEVVLGSSCLLASTQTLVSVTAATYATFALVVGFVLLARPAVQSCGCFGSGSARPSWWHVAFNLFFAAAIGAAAAYHAAPLAAVISATGPFFAIYAAGVMGSAYFGYLALGPVGEVWQRSRMLRTAGGAFPDSNQGGHS